MNATTYPNFARCMPLPNRPTQPLTRLLLRHMMPSSLAFLLVMVASLPSGKPSGTPLENSGLLVASGGNMLGCSSLLLAWVVARNPLPLPPCPLWPITALFTSHWGTSLLSPYSPTYQKFAVAHHGVPERSLYVNSYFSLKRLYLTLFQASDGSRQPSALEIELATIHGESFGTAIKKVAF